MENGYDLVLASKSGRRADLLSRIGIRYRVIVPDVDETLMKDESPADGAIRLAELKAREVWSGLPASGKPVVLAADTLVVCGKEIMGKPVDREHGIRMLRKLSGNDHRVLTGVAVMSGIHSESTLVETKVRFRTLTDREMENYWYTGEPGDKAGGYGIQGIGEIFVDAIEGSYSNVVGLPLRETADMLSRFGICCLPSSGEEKSGQDKEVTGHG